MNSTTERRLIRRQRWWWRWAGAAIVAATAIAVAVLATRPDPAPAIVVSPSDGAVLAAAPSEVSVTFGTGTAVQQVHLAVTTVDGEAVTAGPTRLRAGTAVVPLSITGPGSYLIGYHAFLADGEEASGLSRFTVSADGAGSTDPLPTAAPPDPLAGGHNHDPTDPISFAFLGLDALLLVAVVALLVRRPKPR